MKRISIDDFDGGVNDIDDATLIPNNACVEIKNYEYRDLDGMKRRFGIDNNILNDAKIEDIKSFDIWYPNNLLSDMFGDKIFVLHKKIVEEAKLSNPQWLYFAGTELAWKTGADRITAEWYSMNNVDNYTLEVATDEAFTSIFGTYYVVGSALSYTVTGLTASTTYYLRIKAIRKNKESGYSEIATVPVSTPEAYFAFSAGVITDFYPTGVEENLTEVTVVYIPAYYNGSDVTSIGLNAFSYCASITSIIIPSSVTSIGIYAFNACTSLASIIIPNSVITIGTLAFHRCTSLTSIIIPDGVTSIGDSAFYNCASITSIIIPSSVTSIGEAVFQSCASLTSVTTLNSVTSIGLNAFYGCTSLTSVTIPNTVVSIGNNAFAECAALENITIPNSVTSIGEAAFYNCTSLTSVTIPNSVTSISKNAFNSCTSLESIVISNSVTSIGENTFYDCPLDTIKIGTSVTIDETSTTMGTNAGFRDFYLTQSSEGGIYVYTGGNWTLS